MGRRAALLLAALLAPSDHGALADEGVRGVPRSKWASYLAGGDTFSCLDGTATMPLSQLNDDYCDCPDGSDEPGTSACPGSQFFCLNRGFRSEYVRSSLVGDGVCDCCDGADEYASGACPNSCAEAGERARKEAAARVLTVTAGLEKAKQWAQEGAASKGKWDGELAELKASLSERQAAAAAIEEQKQKAEEREKELREEHRKKKEAEEAAKKLAEQEAQNATAEETDCVSWRVTGGCDPNGVREPDNDLGCFAAVPAGSSGYCECKGGRKVAESGCGHDVFTCHKRCSEAPAPGDASSEEDAAAKAAMAEVHADALPDGESAPSEPAAGGAAAAAAAGEATEPASEVSAEDASPGEAAGVGEFEDTPVGEFEDTPVGEFDATPAVETDPSDLDDPPPPEYEPPEYDPDWDDTHRRYGGDPDENPDEPYEDYGKDTDYGSRYSDDDLPTDHGAFYEEEEEDEEEAPASGGAMGTVMHAMSSVWSKVRYVFGFGWAGELFGGKRSKRSSKSGRVPPPFPDFVDPEAEELRDKHRKAEDEVREVERKISDLEKRMGTDYGPERRFQPLSHECFEFKPGGEWNYELCPYKDAKQKGASGGGSTSIGNWEGFAEGGYTTMRFTQGAYCWNGPSRSLTVTLSCGEENVILGVEEPEVCTYTMRFATPAACTDEHLSSAQADVDALAAVHSNQHDEL